MHPVCTRTETVTSRLFTSHQRKHFGMIKSSKMCQLHSVTHKNVQQPFYFILVFYLSKYKYMHTNFQRFMRNKEMNG